MPRVILYLIAVWAVVCASGLAVFLFEAFGPGSDVNSSAYLEGPLVTAGFWVFLWVVPTVVLVVIGRRQRSRQD